MNLLVPHFRCLWISICFFPTCAKRCRWRLRPDICGWSDLHWIRLFLWWHRSSNISSRYGHDGASICAILLMWIWLLWLSMPTYDNNNLPLRRKTWLQPNHPRYLHESWWILSFWDWRSFLCQWRQMPSYWKRDHVNRAKVSTIILRTCIKVKISFAAIYYIDQQIMLTPSILTRRQWEGQVQL